MGRHIDKNFLMRGQNGSTQYAEFECLQGDVVMPGSVLQRQALTSREKPRMVGVVAERGR